jgi:hypothetical protein
MSKKSYSQILDNAARNHLAKNSDMAPQIMLQIQNRKGASMKTRMKVFVSVTLILLVLVIGLVNAPAVLAAVQRWFGYVPGIGLVRAGEMRVLAEPVSVVRDGIRLTVEQVFVDSEKTSVVYSVDGLKPEMLEFKAGPNSSGCYKNAILRWPGKELLPMQTSGTGWASGYKHVNNFALIPATINEVTFVLPCIQSTLPGKAPVDWSLPLKLVAAPPDLTAFPVIEIASVTAPASTVTPQDSSGPTPSDVAASGLNPADIKLSLERAVQMDDGYLLYASLSWENKSILWVDLYDSNKIHLLDAQGQEIPFAMMDPNDLARDTTPQAQHVVFGIKTAPIPDPELLTIAVDAVVVTLPAEASFEFDPGPAPKPGESWDVNQAVDLGFGHSLRVLKASYPARKNMPQRAGFSFEMESDNGVSSAMLTDHAHPVAGGGGGGGGSQSESFNGGFSYAGDIPAGPITVNIESFSSSLKGDWQAQWQTPSAPKGQVTPTPQPSACLTRTSWEQALKTSAALPAGLGGKLGRSYAGPPDYYYQAFVDNLDGSASKSIGLGDMPSLAPDGSRVVYNGPMKDGPANGLYIMELASGETTLLPGTARGDFNPLWSGDGSQIAFTRGPSSGLIGAPGPHNIILVGADGSNLRELTTGSDYNYATAWMPDGKHILFTKPERDFVSVNSIDVDTREVDSLFEINYNGSMVVSPDGKRLAFEEMLPLDKYGLYVSDLHGSNRRLLADGNYYIVTVPSWSPDGKWVVASVQDPNANKQPNPVLALIEVDTCEIIPLPSLGGYVSSWLP